MYSYFIIVPTNIILLLYVRLARAKRQTRPEIISNTKLNTTTDAHWLPSRCCYYYLHRYDNRRGFYTWYIIYIFNIMSYTCTVTTTTTAVLHADRIIITCYIIHAVTYKNALPVHWTRTTTTAARWRPRLRNVRTWSCIFSWDYRLPLPLGGPAAHVTVTG